MKKVRFGVIGLGAMGSNHAQWIREDKTGVMSLTAVSDVIPGKKQLAKKLGVPFFDTASAMYESGLVDAVIIAMPHYWHKPMAFRAARKKIHVLCEKPLGPTVDDAREIIAECRKRKVALGAMLQQRTRPAMMKMKQMVDRGAIGEVFRVELICSNWFRTQAYYDSGAWRGTWDGEGGGVLLNQAPHSLDHFQWIGLGLPKRVVAMLATREHKIEVEDTANVLCDYGNGKIGYIYATTAEAAGKEQLVVIGDKGTLICDDGEKLRWGKLKVPISRHVYTSKVASAGMGSKSKAQQKLTWTKVKVPSKKWGHVLVARAFARHLLKGTPMIATGAESITELEISNAAYLSGFNNSKSVDLPVRPRQMNALLNRLIRERSTGKGGGIRTRAAREMKKILAGK
jgi:predicted dehydrogenase